MPDFNYITAEETYRSLYYQLPKVLFTSETYRSMSNDSKIAYAMLQDRCEYSIKNNWIDSDGRVYFKFKTTDLMELLMCGNKKVAKIKKELKDFNLLADKRIPPKRQADGTFKHVSPILYLGKLDVSAQDVFVIQNSSESVKSTLSPEVTNDVLSSENVKTTLSEETPLNQGSFESVKTTRYLLDSKELDTNDTNDTQQAQEKLLLDIFVEQANNPSTQGLSQACLQTIATFSNNSVEEAEKTVGTIIKAKYVIQNKTGQSLTFEQWDEEIHKTLKDVYFNLIKKKKQGKLKSSQAFIYTSMANLFTECANRQLDSKKSFPTIPISEDIYN